MNRFTLSLLLASLPATAVLADEGHTHAQPIDGLSNHSLPITTRSEDAQRFFDQGLRLSYGFNHGEAARAFRQAVAHDPDCAMCYWGLSLVLGPNINAAMDPANHDEALSALRNAQRLAGQSTAKEQAYIEALGHRYAEEFVDDRAALDKAYADAMRRVARRFADDVDAGTLFAEALMDTTPWDYWTADGEPKAITQEFLDELETVLRKKPDHLGANHLLIHTLEKERPQLGVTAAERLEGVAPAAGHLVHMPSHIYIRVGRYADAARVNEDAIRADDEYAKAHEVPAEYYGYMLHNHHMLWAAANFEGRKERALRAAHHMSSHVDQEAMRDPAFGAGQNYFVTPLFTMVRFGDWSSILEQEEPASDLLYPRGIWHFARGLAFLRQGETQKAAVEQKELSRLAATQALDEVTIWGLNSVRTLLQIAEDALAGEIAAADKNYDQAVRRLENAVEREDSLTYDEPPPWGVPTRQLLGAILLDAGRAEDAETVYKKDLEVYPRNGWSLTGLVASLRAQRREQEAHSLQKELDEVWQRTEVALATSRF